jgi:hypothetical protein
MATGPALTKAVLDMCVPVAPAAPCKQRVYRASSPHDNLVHQEERYGEREITTARRHFMTKIVEIDIFVAACMPRFLYVLESVVPPGLLFFQVFRTSQICRVSKENIGNKPGANTRPYACQNAFVSRPSFFF